MFASMAKFYSPRSDHVEADARVVQAVLDEFYEIINDPGKARREFSRNCQRWESQNGG